MASKIVNPGQSISSAMQTASPGDSILVRAGSYIEEIYFPGGLPSGLTVKGYPGDPRPWLRGDVTIGATSGFTWDGINIDGIDGFHGDMDGLMVNGCQNCLFQNSEIANSQRNGVLTHDGNGILRNVIFRNLVVHDTGLDGICDPGRHCFYISAHNQKALGIVVENCEMYNANRCPNSWGIQVYAYADYGFVDGVIVRSNYIHDCSLGLLMGCGPNHQAYNNVITSCGSNSDGEAALSIGYGIADNVQAYNNTVVGNALPCIGIQERFGAITNAQVENNLCWQNAGGVIDKGTNTHLFDNSIEVQPPFVSASDFHLTAPFGPAIDLSSIFATDKDGAARTAPWDVGAYAFQKKNGGGKPPVNDPIYTLAQLQADNCAVTTIFGADGTTAYTPRQYAQTFYNVDIGPGLSDGGCGSTGGGGGGTGGGGGGTGGGAPPGGGTGGMTSTELAVIGVFAAYFILKG